MAERRDNVPGRDRRLDPLERRFGCGSKAMQPSFLEEMWDVVDDIRQMATDFGARPYRVFCIVVAWDGGEVGRGNQSILSEQELLPTPYVDLSSVRYTVRSGGRTDDGETTLYEVSPRYSEAEIHELFPRALAANEQAFVEVRLDSRDGAEVTRHRLTIAGVPYLDAEGAQWVVRLKIQQEERTSTGQLSERVPTTDVNPLTLGMPPIPEDGP